MTDWIRTVVEKNRRLQKNDYSRDRFPADVAVWNQLTVEINECINYYARICGRPVFCAGQPPDQKLRCFVVADSNPDNILLKVVYDEDAGCIDAAVPARNSTKHLELVLDEQNDVRLSYKDRLIAINEVARVLLAPVLFGLEVFIKGTPDPVGPAAGDKN
jgi:hypothetical protein